MAGHAFCGGASGTLRDSLLQLSESPTTCCDGMDSDSCETSKDCTPWSLRVAGTSHNRSDEGQYSVSARFVSGELAKEFLRRSIEIYIWRP